MEVIDAQITGQQLIARQQEAMSPLMRAKKNNPKGQKVNVCPFGCAIEKLDSNGYCRHLVGVSKGGRDYEPHVKKRGRYTVQVHREKIPTGEIGPDGQPEWEWGPPELPAVPEGAKLVTIVSDYYRVYVDVDAEAKKAAEAARVAAERAGAGNKVQELNRPN